MDSGDEILMSIMKREPIKDSVRAYQYERAFLSVMSQIKRENRLKEDEIKAIDSYVDGLLTAIQLVCQAARYSASVAGSEYVDERGAVDGTLLAIYSMASHMRSNWKFFLEEKNKNRELERVNALLVRYILNDAIIDRHDQYLGNVWDRAHDDQQKIVNQVRDITTQNGSVELWAHLFPPEEKS